MNTDDTVPIYCWECKQDVEAELQTSVEVLDAAVWLIHVSVEAVCTECRVGFGPSFGQTVRLSS